MVCLQLVTSVYVSLNESLLKYQMRVAFANQESSDRLSHFGPLLPFLLRFINKIDQD